MFSLRGRLASNAHYDSEFFAKLTSDLKDAGFTEMRIKLPHNQVEEGKHEISVQEFVDGERNYSSLILVARNERLNETLKILFGNIPREAFFYDNTFPSGHSQPSELYVQSPDPARVYALYQFFRDYMLKTSTRPGLAVIFWDFFAVFFLIFEVMFLLGIRTGIFAYYYDGQAILVDLIGIVLALAILSGLLRRPPKPPGLYIKPPPRSALAVYLERMLRGELRDNPIVNILVYAIAGVIIALILRLMGLP